MALLCLPSTVTKASTVTPEQALIKGIAQWQAGRVEELLVSQVFNQVFDVPYVKRYFPITVRNLLIYDSTNAMRLIPIAEHYLKQDLDNLERLIGVCLPDRAVEALMQMAGVGLDASNEIIDVAPNPQESVQSLIILYQAVINLSIDPEENVVKRVDKLSEAVDAMSFTTSKYQRVDSLIAAMHLGTDGPIQKAASSSYGDARDVVGIDQLLGQLCGGVGPDTLATLKVANDRVKARLKARRLSWDDAMEDLAEEIKSHPMTNLLPDNFSNPQFLNRFFLEVQQGLVSYKEANDSQQSSFTVLAHRLLLLVDQYGKMRSTNIEKFTQLSESVLFLAELVDAANAKVEPEVLVASVLKTYVDGEGALVAKRKPSGYKNSFPMKIYNYEKDQVKTKTFTRSCRAAFRTTCRNTLFIGSFYGLSVVNGEEQGTTWRGFGPIGLEWKPFVWGGRPITLNFAPFDIGNYVTSELTGKGYSASLDDIVAPSVFVALSGRETPVALLVGYQHGIRVEEDIEDESWFVALTFDLPIFTLY